MASLNIYLEYPFQVQMMERHNWCNLDNLLDFVTCFRYNGFHSSANRKAIRDAYVCLRCTAPFNENCRFLNDDLYVHLDNPNISKAISLILTGLDVSQDLIDTKIVLKPGRYSRLIKYISDAKKSFDDGFTLLHKLITVTDKDDMKSNGIYSCETFEAHFGLLWGEETKQIRKEPKKIEKEPKTKSWYSLEKEWDWCKMHGGEI